MPGKKDKTEWRYSEARALLEKDLVDGTIPIDSDLMEPQVVYGQRPEFSDFPYKKFRDNLSAARRRHRDAKNRSATDAAALAHDRGIYPKKATNHRGEPRWDGSQAQALLKIDVHEGKNRTMAPNALRDSRAEYQEFPLDVFRGHIHQEWKRQKLIRQLQDKAAGRLDPAYDNLNL